jgi:hypothetical protein
MTMSTTPASHRHQPYRWFAALGVFLVVSIQLITAVDPPPHDALFQHVPEIQVLGPTVFPKPTHILGDDESVAVALTPVIGQHRPDQDAVFAMASEYESRAYALFIGSLRKTGFKGDIVLVVLEKDLKNDDVKKILSSPGVVIYTPKVTCFNFEGERQESPNGGMRICESPFLYSVNGTAVHDPRHKRTIAISRYELYWIMAINYNPSSWLFLVDARDTYFQSNPFSFVPRKSDPSGDSGLLYFFGENVDATRLGKSKQNAKWLLNAYGEVIQRALADKPTICSGATMGEQVALEAYLRAMVAETDETVVVIQGADQGFHNFLYYSHKLSNALHIHAIVVFDQGTGIVNVSLTVAYAVCSPFTV